MKLLMVISSRFEPNMLKNLPIIFLPELPKIFTYYSYFIPITPSIIPFLFYCVSDNITMQKWLYNLCSY